MRVALLVWLMALTACTLPDSGVAGRRTLAPIDLPPMKTFAPQSYAVRGQSNAELARDFLELSFQMESGRKIPQFSRFEGPITVSLIGDPVPAQVGHDLDALLRRIRNEARISITRAEAPDTASITVQAISRGKLQRLVPDAACFVVPNVSSWDEYRRLRRNSEIDWTQVKTRTRAAIFLPSDVAPQEIRDCLHEELGQALGPLNDIYRLPNSIFNDDNFHTVLTGFDMLILRATYSPRLKSGMTQAQVADRLPGIFRAINPGGGTGIAQPIDTPRVWIEAVETALGGKVSDARRLQAASKALAVAQTNEWTDSRLAYSLFLVARVSMTNRGNEALANFFHARSLYGSNDQTDLQTAHIDMQLAAYALSSGDAQGTIELVNRHTAIVAKAENAALLSTLLLIKAEALTMLGQIKDAEIVREDGLGWARYGFGGDDDVGDRLSEIASLRPLI